MGKKQKTVILINNSSSIFIQMVEDVLDKSNIPSVHISGGFNQPTIVGLRVRTDDFGKAKEIITEINPFFDNYVSEPTDSFGKIQTIGCVAIVAIGAVYLIVDAVLGLSL